jgi:hypothetical protein
VTCERDLKAIGDRRLIPAITPRVGDVRLLASGDAGAVASGNTGELFRMIRPDEPVVNVSHFLVRLGVYIERQLMRYWWVNQNQTYRAEVRGSFMWSPKQNANGARNQFYENMREVSRRRRVFVLGYAHQGDRRRDRRSAGGCET